MLGTVGWNSGCKPHYTIKKNLIILVVLSSCKSDQAVCLKELLVVVVLGCKEELSRRGGPSSFFIMTHVNIVTQNIQLVLSLLFSY